MFPHFNFRSWTWLFILLPTISYTQSNEFELSLSGADLVILEERTNCIVSGQKSYLMEFTVEKDIAFKINNPAGVAVLDTIILPEPFDETYILHAPHIRKNVSSISSLRVTKFIAEVEKPNGTKKILEPEIKMVSERIVTTSIGESNHYYYIFKELEQGDILKISYSYSFLFKENWYKLFSTRVFFHSRYPKLACDFTLSHPGTLKVDTSLVHLEAPVFRHENDRKSYSWHMENLPGCLGEPWSRPYEELPNFIFSLKPYELIYEEFNSFKQQFVPLWLFLCYHRETDISVAIIDNNIGAKDKDNLTYEKLAAKFITMAGDDRNGLKSLQYLQRWIVDSVKYEDSYLYYDNQENYKVHRPGIELQGGVMQDFAMEQIYANMILKLGLNFFTAYPVDKRCGEISEHYFSPMYDNDVLFAAVLKDNVISYLIPFSEYNQYYVEELPFYYEDIPVILVNSFDFGGYKVNILDSARIVKTPESLLTDNTRKVVSAVNVDLDSGTSSFTTALTLKGQFSTLCRFPYLNKPVDMTVNPRYHKKVWNISDDVVLTRLEPTPTQLLFPFTTKINAEYSSRNILEKMSEDFIVHIQDWVNHVVPEDYDPDFRYTDFYPDFIGADNYTYELTFNHPVKLDGENKNIQLTRDFGSYSFSIIQTAENKILIVSTFIIKNPVIPKEKHSEMIEMLNTVNQRRALDIRILTVSGK